MKLFLPYLLLLTILFPTRLLAQQSDFELIWADEFDYTGALDTTKWFHQTRLPNGNSWYNGEIQHYTDRVDNASVANGYLYITAKRETYSDQGVTKDFTSARLNSKFAFTYGRVEVRAKLPTGIGTWPAIWMLGQNITEPGAYWQQQGYGTTSWPGCGEIDIMEHWGHNQDYVSSAIHTPSSFGATVNVGGRMLPNASDSFHVYTLEWTADSLIFSVDSVIHYTYAPATKTPSTWPFHAPQYLLLNIAIQATIDPQFTESAMVVDYVRVFQRNAKTGIENSSERSFFCSPNPFHSSLTISLPAASAGDCVIRLFDTTGRIVFQEVTQHVQNNTPITGLESLQPGVYILQVTTNGVPYSQTLLKS